MTSSLNTPTGLRNRQSAEDYDRMTATALDPWDALFVARCEALRPQPPGLFVDVGAGTGVLLERLHARPAFAGWQFVGIEHFDDMVTAGNARLARGAPGVEMRKGDAQALPFADGSLAMVVSRATIHHLPDKPGALREMHRVLRPGGIGLIHDARRDMPEAVLKRFNEMRAAVGYGPTTLEEKLTVAEMAAHLAVAGLSGCSRVLSGDAGLEAIGFEVVIEKRE